MDERALRKYRQFYILYPQLLDPIRGALTTISEIPALPVKIEELSQPVNKLQKYLFRNCLTPISNNYFPLTSRSNVLFMNLNALKE
ncbi:hypothetical protein CLV98_109171 [Dyadobacter jejuensis]|uniref:Uncharacterized protein n=1 Tax=Dyadobacter jejuensis TaxID=1082580 RepID=A0A316AHF0_9BACT|nr:hypothetical protein CLV98_109171 [Dyadobacter jejuensis]